MIIIRWHCRPEGGHRAERKADVQLTRMSKKVEALYAFRSAWADRRDSKADGSAGRLGRFAHEAERTGPPLVAPREPPDG